PGAAIAAAETSKELERAEVRFLYHVLRILVATRQPAREIVGGVQVRQYCLLKPRKPAVIVQLLVTPCESCRPVKDYSSAQFIPEWHSRLALWRGRKQNRA